MDLFFEAKKMGNAGYFGFSAVIPALIAVATTFASPLTDNRLPPKPVNTFLLGDASYLYRHSIEQSDVELLAYIKQIYHYSTEVEGDWITYRYLIECDVIECVVGQWTDGQLRFTCSVLRPTPESGITSRSVHFPYSIGCIFYFQLQRQGDSPLHRIIGQEQRSPTPPYEPLRRPTVDPNDHTQGQYRASIRRAAQGFFEKQLETTVGGIQIIHQTDDYYVVEGRRWDERVGIAHYVVIDKETLDTSSPPSPCLLAVDRKTPDDNREALVPLRIDSPLMGHVDFIDHSAIPNLQPNWWVKRPPFLVPERTSNVALHKPVSSSSKTLVGDLSMITNGRKQPTSSYDPLVELMPGVQHITIDLESEHTLYAIVFWHVYMMFPVYKDIIVQVSNDPDFETDVITLFNNDHDNSSGLGYGTDKNFVQMEEGRLVDAEGVRARYVRLYSNGSYSHEHGYNHYVEVEVYGIPVTDCDAAKTKAEDAEESK